MNRFKSIAFISGLVALACVSPSCLDENDDNVALYRPTALVTVRPAADGTFSMQLDDVTTLLPANVKTSPFGAKEVRALVNYNDNGETGSVRTVHINWMDSIRTKNTVPSLGDENDLRYGKDPIEVVRDWVTVAEDGYLTLRIRTLWGTANNRHYINLLTGVNPENPYELELRHDAKGDVNGVTGDALIAFRLADLPAADANPVKIKLNWMSFSGKKSAEFELGRAQQNPTATTDKSTHDDLVD